MEGVESSLLFLSDPFDFGFAVRESRCRVEGSDEDDVFVFVLAPHWH